VGLTCGPHTHTSQLLQDIITIVQRSWLAKAPARSVFQARPPVFEEVVEKTRRKAALLDCVQWQSSPSQEGKKIDARGDGAGEGAYDTTPP
jgi:hypothetical protein